MRERSTIEVRKRILEANEEAARQLRDLFNQAEILTVNLISSPGSGKTTLLEATVKRLGGRFRLAALEGDIETERDAERLRAMGIPARQILTGGACHLDARQVRKELSDARVSEFDILFIENVGNLICPASYDLGEDFKIALLSVAEGDDKPYKYPAIFSRARATVITKTDLLEYVEFDLEAVRTQVRTLNPNGIFLTTSARTGSGIDDWIEFLVAELNQKRGL